MNTIGKIAVLAMTLSLAFVLSACGGSASSSAASSSAADSSASASASTSESASAESAAVSSESESASAESASAATEAAIEAATADTYTNEAFGIRFNLPEGWTFTDVSTIKDITSSLNSVPTDAELDMVASNADESQMVMVTITAPNDANKGMTAEQYIEDLQKQTEETLEGNYQYSTVTASITFDGIDREIPALLTTANVEGIDIVTCQAADEKDGYFFTATATGTTQDEVSKAFEYFAAATE